MNTPPRPDPALIDSLRADLRAARYVHDGVSDLLGDLAGAALSREEPAPARVLLRGNDAPIATLATMFLLGDPVPSAALAHAFPTLGLDGALELGLIAVSDDHARAVVDLRPYASQDEAGEIEWWLASDLGELVTGDALDGDHVLGAGGASLTLAQVTTRTAVGRVLDLGTGSGIQALHATRHAHTVVATDISVRALAYARFNALLNGVELDLRAGSMLEPVAGEHFDLVVSNPPFVITPRSEGDLPHYEYRDGGRAGDDLVRDLIVGVRDVLAPGGRAQFLGNWEHRRGQDWSDRVGGWLDEAGLDGWVIQREVLDPAQYAETWIRDGGLSSERDPAAWAQAYERWLEDFASRDVEAIGFGILTLRRPESGVVTLRRLEEHTGSIHQPLGAHLGASLDAHDWLEARDDDALAAEHLCVAPDVSEERFYTPGASDPNVIIIRQGGGLGRAVHSSTALAALVGACDGELPVGVLIDAIAHLFEVDAQALRSEVLPGVRGLVRDGLLTV